MSGNKATFINMHINVNVIEADIRGVLQKKDALKSFAKFAGKHLCKSLFFDKAAGLRPVTFY